ncbi:hypothetical protein ACEWA7_20310 [Vibrio parahaemolyticus]
MKWRSILQSNKACTAARIAAVRHEGRTSLLVAIAGIVAGGLTFVPPRN